MNFLGRPYTGGSTQQPQMSLASLGQQVSQPQRPAGGGNPWGGSMGGVMNPQGGYQWGGGGQGAGAFSGGAMGATMGAPGGFNFGGGNVWGNRGGGPSLSSFSAPQVAPMGQPPPPGQAVQAGITFGNPMPMAPPDGGIRAIDGVVAGNAPGMPSFNAGTGGSIWPNQQAMLPPQAQGNPYAMPVGAMGGTIQPQDPNAPPPVRPIGGIGNIWNRR